MIKYRNLFYLETAIELNTKGVVVLVRNTIAVFVGEIVFSLDKQIFVKVVVD